jgi:hypothetical protein
MTIGIAIFALIGIVFIGFLISRLIMPMVFWLMNKIALGLTYLLCLLQRKPIMPNMFCSPNKPNNDTCECKNDINLPNPIHNSRNFEINKQPISEIPSIHNLSESNNRNVKKDTLNMAKKPVAKKTEKMFDILHNVAKYYQRFYGKSTKREPNQILVTPSTELVMAKLPPVVRPITHRTYDLPKKLAQRHAHKKTITSKGFRIAAQHRAKRGGGITRRSDR